MRVVDRIVKSAAFWMGAAAALLISLRETVLNTSQWQNLLSLTNFPLAALLHIAFPAMMEVGIPGGSYTRWDMFLWYLPFYALYFVSYIGYGLLLDLVIRRVRRCSAGDTTATKEGNKS